MPRPAKPPMTLKEAKRAYKKEGAVSRYTATQMVRADRIDAREARRQKLVDKERNRVDNKRKREEKEEKECSVRQKMLEEGRIKPEDTWGKVTPSQPRLNMFFGRNNRATSVKTRLSAQIDAVRTDTGDTSVDQVDVFGDDCDAEDEGVEAEQASPQEPKPVTVVEVAQGHKKSTAPVPSPLEIQQQRLDVEKTAQTSQNQPFLSTRSQHAILRDLSLSRINASSSKLQIPSNAVNASPLKEIVSAPQSSLRSTRSSTRTSITASGRSPAEVLNSSCSNTVSEGSPTEILEARNDDDRHNTAEVDIRKRFGPGLPHGGETQDVDCGVETSRSSILSLEDDEDFTDGIDDETFLMLCSTQKPGRQNTRTKVAPIVTSPSTILSRDCRSDYPEKADVDVKVNQCDVNTDGKHPLQSHGGTESFNSIFNEIEEEDLIALAEKVEAEFATPLQTPTASAARSKEKATPRSQTQQHREERVLQEISNPSAAPPLKEGAETSTVNRSSSSSKYQQIIEKKPSVRIGTNPRAIASVPPGKVNTLQIKSTTPQLARLKPPNSPSNRVSTNFKLPPLPAPRANFLQATSEPLHPAESRKKRRVPWVVNPPEEEFPELSLGPATQALALEFLGQVEARVSQENGRVARS